MSDTIDPNLTRADRGVLVYEALTQFFAETLKTKDAKGAQIATTQYKEAATHLAEATGARFTLVSAVNTMTTDDKAVVLAQTVRRAQQFVTTLLRSMDFSITIERPRKFLKNIVDHQLYEHLLTIRADNGKVLCFAIATGGNYVLSESDYWLDPV